VFNPSTWALSIALYSIALWLAIDLIFQIHITFKRFGGWYYWTVLATSIGVGLHASLLTVKSFTVLTIAEDIGTTILVKMGDILTQTGFSLVLYSRLNLVMRSHKYLKRILTIIIVSSFLVHVPTVVFTIGVNTRTLGWLNRAQVAEKVVVIWFTIQEQALSTIYTYCTARLLKNSPAMLSRSPSPLRHQTKKSHRNLLVFMIFTQFVTFTFDMTLVLLIMLKWRFKGIFMPILYGIKLKVEFLALNQLQILVQPKEPMFVFTNDMGPADKLPQGEIEVGLEGVGVTNQSSADGCKSLCPHCGSTSNNSIWKDSELNIASEQNPTRIGQRMLQPPMVQTSQVSSTGSVSKLERQYLGRLKI
jgi:hypothetical protein